MKDLIFKDLRGIFTRRESRQLVSSLGLTVAADEIRELDPASPTVPDEISRLELTRYVRNQLVRDSDSASMANGVELRAPFPLDRRPRHSGQL